MTLRDECVSKLMILFLYFLDESIVKASIKDFNVISFTGLHMKSLFKVEDLKNKCVYQLILLS
jgi:hypothetical protein